MILAGAISTASSSSYFHAPPELSQNRIAAGQGIRVGTSMQMPNPLILTLKNNCTTLSYCMNDSIGTKYTKNTNEPSPSVAVGRSICWASTVKPPREGGTKMGVSVQSRPCDLDCQFALKPLNDRMGRSPSRRASFRSPVSMPWGCLLWSPTVLSNEYCYNGTITKAPARLRILSGQRLAPQGSPGTAGAVAYLCISATSAHVPLLPQRCPWSLHLRYRRTSATPAVRNTVKPYTISSRISHIRL
jgi:hypothetical protein